MSGRIARRFAALKAEDRAGFIAFVTAGDPDLATSIEIVRGLAAAGADLIEIGMPFTDPMADGPAIQASSLRALKGGQTMARTFQIVRALRETDAETPAVLMGYLNPILAYGPERFMDDARGAGVDGLILVDLPPEEDGELRAALDGAGLDLIRLATPTTDEARLPAVLAGAGGFLYYVSIAGVTGTRAYDAGAVAAQVARIRAASRLPVAVGFGIRTSAQAAEIARIADAAVVGSALVDEAARAAAAKGPGPHVAQAVLDLARRLADGVRMARQ